MERNHNIHTTMSNFKNKELEKAILSNQDIEVKKGFLGLGKKYIYKPTKSNIRIVCEYFNNEKGNNIEKLLSKPIDEIAKEIETKPQIEGDQMGNIQLEAAISDDGQFVAYQIAKYSDFEYVAEGEVKIYTGEEAKIVAKAL